MKQPEGSGAPTRPALPLFVEARDGTHFILIDNVLYECVHEPDPPSPRVAAFPPTRVPMYGNAYQMAQRLHQLEEEDRVRAPLDPDGNPLPLEPPPSPAESKQALRDLVRARFEEAANDELFEEYAKRTDNNEKIKAALAEWRAGKEQERADREAAVPNG
jgi:hypothetical protein